VLAHSLVTAKGASPAHYALFLHGILGTRANWRGVARRVVERRPEWGAILVDLREHGDSLGKPPPHTIAACAQDVAALVESLGLPVRGALGHSFGGKVVLEWLRGRDGMATSGWIIDSTPSLRNVVHEDGSETAEVLGVLGSLPAEWDTRESFVAAITDSGLTEPIAHWLAMNLRRTDDGGRRFGPDLGTIRTLLVDYADTDEWPVVESIPEGCSLDFVLGARSAVVSEEDRVRLGAIAARDPRLRVHVVEDAGHWVHVDAPETLISLLVAGFASSPGDGT
jgi:pimeloyl-ACP methyl ester carboxylesterase